MNDSAITPTQARIPDIIEQLSKKIVGQRSTLELVTAACLAGGHVLLQDVPGTGKTRLAASLAKVFGLAFCRIQGTPDLLPADVVGATVFNPGDNRFTFHRGPIFTNVLLMDEINRATPRTQSALLEAMAEQQVSADGTTYRLPKPFFVIATANPIESQGVFPLPEAQLDRFLVQLNLGYIAAEEEIEMVRRVVFTKDEELSAVLDEQDVVKAQEEVRQILVSDDVLRYIVALGRATRTHDQVELGASPRAIVALTQYAQALAYLAQRRFVTPDDVKRAFYPTMAHRLQLNIDWMGEDGAKRVIEDVLQGVPVPNERAGV
ncbi:AAA family ATPase [Alicyclobacillus fastidiosus]|uniref:MoxR family ATPase n=1 Tax=Alicyclobacillus fastidiosus TaxID=392011 RepID=A0ABV5AII4_9BACL|nr:MoxR family ATPase [Alicyclobacillus fastidiosus]WEH11169.1 MoxR family ATPase [Alicyclobacillus fastidiosus]